MAALDINESMDEDFTGFDEEPVVVNTGGTPLIQDNRIDETPAETDSDSGNLVIAEPHKKVESKSVEKSPRKRKSRVEDVTPTRTPSSRVRGQGLAYLLAMEKGGSKKQLAKVQAQSDLQDTPSSSQSVDPPAPVQTEAVVEPEVEKKKVGKEVKENAKVIKEKEPAKISKEKEIPQAAALPTTNSPTPVVKSSKSNARKSYSAVNISSPLLKEPFKDGSVLNVCKLKLVNLNVWCFSSPLLGWRREVVYRATVDPGTKTLCDVYYYTPDGKKLRSGREVSDFCKASNNNVHNL